jgi:hypothetical protein
MNWAMLIPVIVKYGVPFAEKMWTLFSAGGVPTAADWAELKRLSNQTANTQMTDALTRAGIALDSDEAKALLALVS